MSRASDPGRRLLRALDHAAAVAGASAAGFRHERLTPWASATFVGGVHRLRAIGADAAWLATLPDAELPMHGHYVASLAVAVDGDDAVLTVLVLED